MATALATLMSLPAVALATDRSPLMRLARLEAALGPSAPRIFIKRDDLLSFGLGGNKVRKFSLIAAAASAVKADSIITCGALQSNHCRVAAAVGAVLGFRVLLVLSGEPPDEATRNLWLDELFGAEVYFVRSRDDRDAAMEELAKRESSCGRRAYVVPTGGSTALGAAGMARAVAELGATGVKPDLIVHASSSGGTQAGLIAGCALMGFPSRVIGISADEPAVALSARVEALLASLADLLAARPGSLAPPDAVEVDDSQVGTGYGIPTPESLEACRLLARAEGIVLESVYGAKAFAGFLSRVRSGTIQASQTVLFWQTGGFV